MTRAGLRSHFAGEQSTGGVSVSAAAVLVSSLRKSALRTPTCATSALQWAPLSETAAIGRVVAIPAYPRRGPVEVGKLHWHNVSADAIDQQPVAALPNPFTLLGRVTGQRVVQAIRALHHKLAIGNIVRIAGGVILQLSVNIQWTHGDGNGVAFVAAQKHLHRLRLAQKDNVRFGSTPGGIAENQHQYDSRKISEHRRHCALIQRYAVLSDRRK